MEYRKEQDMLGTWEVPADALFDRLVSPESVTRLGSPPRETS